MISILLLQFILCTSFNVYFHVLAWHRFTVCYACMYKSTNKLNYPILSYVLAFRKVAFKLTSLDAISVFHCDKGESAF